EYGAETGRSKTRQHEGDENDVSKKAGDPKFDGPGGARTRTARRAEHGELQRGHRAAAPQPRAAQLVDVPGQLQRLGLQPARADHPRPREEARADVDLLDPRDPGATVSLSR